MTESITIKGRFCGPPSSGNGGYSCGRVAEHIEGSATVRLSIPPPLDTPMALAEEDGKWTLEHQQKVVAAGKANDFDLSIPEPPGFAAAEAASKRFRGFVNHYYPGCFVCGPERGQGDGLRIFAGPVNDPAAPEGMVAATWVPDDSLADSQGNLRPEFVWAALDCPGAYSFKEPQGSALLLGELSVCIQAEVSIGERYVLTGWEIDHQGRKHHTGTALFDESGQCCAFALATWFEVPLADNNQN